MPPAVRTAISDQLRGFIRDRGPGYAIARDAGVDPGVVSRFLNHKRGLTTDTIDRLASALGLRLVEIPRAAGRPRRHGVPGPGPAKGHPDGGASATGRAGPFPMPVE